MATTKPRVTVTLDPMVYQTYELFAKAQDRRVSSVLAEMLTEVEPQIRSTIALLLAAKAAPKEVIANISEVFEEFGRALDDAAGGAQKELDFALRGRGHPPSSNTGVTTNSQDTTRPAHKG